MTGRKISFEWDSKKSSINLKTHGISFEEAKTVFFDETAFEFYDIDHSEHEDRYILLGLSSYLRVLVISYCFRKNDEVIRIISARKATKKEQKEYIKRLQ